MTTAETLQPLDRLPVPEGLQGVIITDCSDDNARARQQVRFSKLFGVVPTFVGLESENKSLEGAGQLVDALDAALLPGSYPETPTLVLLNVAPRGDDVRQKHQNGTPFCYFKVGNTTVLSTYEGSGLSLVHKLGLVSTVHLFDIPTVTRAFVKNRILTPSQAEYVKNTQFRSLEFLQLAARELYGGILELPGQIADVAEHSPEQGNVWFTDIFGNCKTTLLPEDIDFEPGKVVELEGGGKATCYPHLADVPTAETGLTIGSSGYINRRWLELVIQKGRASEKYGITVGSQVLKAA